MMIGKCALDIYNPLLYDIFLKLIQCFVLFFILIGGSVVGRQVLGDYPEDITEEGEWTLSRGRRNIYFPCFSSHFIKFLLQRPLDSNNTLGITFYSHCTMAWY